MKWGEVVVWNEAPFLHAWHSWDGTPTTYAWMYNVLLAVHCIVCLVYFQIYATVKKISITGT